MILFPPAKINLGLNVLKKRDDGYHEVVSCMVEIPLTDILEILPSEQFSFEATGIQIEGDPANNLCVRAYQLLKSEHDIPPVSIHLRKIIPMGAGLGGGSSDATYVLKGLNELFSLGLTEDALERYAATLGSDCPFFVRGGAQMSTGRGEILQPIALDLSSYWIKLVYPQVHIGTAEAYQNVLFQTDCTGYDLLKKGDFSKLVNAFESHAFQKYPQLDALKQQILNEGAFFAAMSGSGSTLFGLYTAKPEKGDLPNSWVFPFA